MNVPISWTSITAFVIAALGAAMGLARLLAESLVKEKVKSAFDQKLEEHKAALDLVKQRALNEAKSELDHKLEDHKTTLDLLKQQSLKDFGLFAEKKHQVNTAVYSALRTAYKTVNQALRGWRSPIQVELYSADDLEQFLISQGVATDERRDLAMLHEISPIVSSMEVNRRMGGFLLNQAQEALLAAQELTYTNELFLSPEVICCCDSVLALLTQGIAEHGDREKLDSALDASPRALWQVMASMRMDLLGNQGRDSEPATYRKEDGRIPLLQNLPTSVQLGDIIGFEEKITRLASRGRDLVGFPAHPPTPNPEADKQQLAVAHERLAASPHDPALRLARGRMLLKSRRPEEAMADAGELLKGSPENLDALLLSADCHLALPFRDSFLRRLRLINEVIGPLTRYLEKASNDGRALYARGFVYFATTDLNEAATDLRAAVSANPNNMDGHALLAEIYRTLKDTWQAIDEADSVLSRSPAHLRAQLTRLELFADSNRWDEIVVVAPQLQRVAPDNPRVIELVGKALNLTNRPSAVLQFQGKHAPGTPAWLAETRAIARAQFALRDLGGALKHCDEVLSKVPADSEANILRIEALAASGRWEEVLSAGVAAYKIVPVGTSESHEMLRFLRTAYKIRSAKGGGQTANGAAPPPDGQALSPNTTSAATDSVI